MNFTGLIIEESLNDVSVMNEVKLLQTEIEPVTPKHKTPWLKQWTLHTVEIPEGSAEEVAKKISTSFDKAHPDWYADYKNDKFHL